MINAFDEILNVHVSDESDRATITTIAEKYPELKNGWLRQSEFSKKMDETRAAQELASKWQTWRVNNWDDEAKMTKAQRQAMDRVRELEDKLSEAGNGEMTVEQMTALLDGELKNRGLVTAEQLAGDKKYIQESLQGHAYLVAKMPVLAQKYKDMTGEYLDGTELLKKVNEYGETDLDKVFERYVAPKMAEKELKEIEAKKAAAQAELDELAKKKENATSPTLPTDQGGDSGISPFQAQMRGIKSPDADVLSNFELGSGGIAAFAAQRFKDRMAQG